MRDHHLRDDELNAMLQRLRRAVGPNGNVVLSVDSCFSGGTSRGTARVRGGPPMGPPAAGATRSIGEDRGGGFFEGGPRSRGISSPASGSGPGSGSGSSELAPYVVFSAARHDQLDYETVDDEGRVVGPLTLALSKTLAGSDRAATYRDLFEKVEREMQPRVPNRPQVEGNIDAELFSGRAVFQRPFLEVTSVRSRGKQVALSAGSLQGLLTGSRVELHREGTREPSPDTLLSVALVSETTALEAIADVETDVARSELQSSRAFVTAYAFGDLRVRVSLDEIGDAGARARLEEALADVSAVEIAAADADAELALRSTDRGRVEIAIASTGAAIYGPADVGVNGGSVMAEIVARLVDYARSRYLRGLWRSRWCRSIPAPVVTRPTRAPAPSSIRRPSAWRVVSSSGRSATTSSSARITRAGVAPTSPSWTSPRTAPSTRSGPSTCWRRRNNCSPARPSRRTSSTPLGSAAGALKPWWRQLSASGFLVLVSGSPDGLREPVVLR